MQQECLLYTKKRFKFTPHFLQWSLRGNKRKFRVVQTLSPCVSACLDANSSGISRLLRVGNILEIKTEHCNFCREGWATGPWEGWLEMLTLGEAWATDARLEGRLELLMLGCPVVLCAPCLSYRWEAWGGLSYHWATDGRLERSRGGLSCQWEGRLELPMLELLRLELLKWV